MRRIFYVISLLLICKFLIGQNPICPSGLNIADPTVPVWEDGKIYVCGSCDERLKYYCSLDYWGLLMSDLIHRDYTSKTFASKEQSDEALNDYLSLQVPDCIYSFFFQPGGGKHFTPKYIYKYKKYMKNINQIDVAVFIGNDAQENNSMVILFSDHKDIDGAHRIKCKTALYKEATNISSLVMWKGHIPQGKVGNVHLVADGLDLQPSVCDYAGIHGVADPGERSLCPFFEDKNTKWIKTLGVESETGRMVVPFNNVDIADVRIPAYGYSTGSIVQYR